MRNFSTRTWMAGLASMIAVPAMAADINVAQSGFSFDPADVTAAPGDTIIWTWASGDHTVTSGSPCVGDGRFNSPLDMATQTFSYTIPANEPDGVIPYFCIPHCVPFSMTGTITVEGPEPIPTVSQWGIMVMGLMVLTAGTVVFVYRRRVEAAA